MVVFDLDPGPPATVVECCTVGLWLEGMLGGLGLETWAKTSGSKGLQLHVPLNAPDATQAQTRAFAKAVAELLEAEEPGLVVSRQTKALRPPEERTQDIPGRRLLPCSRWWTGCCARK